MADSMIEKLVVAISSRVLFDLEDSHRVFEQEGVEAFSRHQVEREEEPLAPGVAYPLVKKLLALNSQEPGRGRVEVILISRNSADTGMRVFNSIRHHNLEITRAAFAGGGSPFQYVKPFGAHLFSRLIRKMFARRWMTGSRPRPSCPARSPPVPSRSCGLPSMATL